VKIQQIVNDETIKDTAPWLAQIHINHRRNLDTEIKMEMATAKLMCQAIGEALAYLGVQHNDDNAIYKAIVDITYHRSGGYGHREKGAGYSVSSSAKIVLQDYNGEDISFFSDNQYVNQIWNEEKECVCITVRYEGEENPYFAARCQFDNEQCKGQAESAIDFMSALSYVIQKGRERREVIESAPDAANGNRFNNPPLEELAALIHRIIEDAVNEHV